MQVAVAGIVVAAIILIAGAFWVGKSASEDTEKAVRNVSLLYLNGLAERREQVVAAKLADYISDLDVAVASNNLDAAFEAAHALKGVLGNLSLTPLYTPMVELTEHLRARETMDYAPLLNQILAKKAELAAL